MRKTYKFRIYPNRSQINIISQTLGCCRFLYNDFIAKNKQRKIDGLGYLSDYGYSKEYLTPMRHSEEFSWLGEISSKAQKDALANANKAFKKFFKNVKKKRKVGKGYGYPRFKSKKDLVQSYFFIKDQIKFKRNHIKIPILGWVRTTESNYIPDCGEITGGRLVKKYDKYYVNLSVKLPKGYRVAEAIEKNSEILNSDADNRAWANQIGIDLGIKQYATIMVVNAKTGGYNCIDYPSFLKDHRYKQLEEDIKTLQRIISNKVEVNKSKNLMKGVCYNSSNIRKLRKKVSKKFERLRNMKIDFINKLVYALAITKPMYIAIEDLSVMRMLQTASHKLSNKIANSLFDEFHQRLRTKCREFDIELRVVDKYFPSSKRCFVCGNINDELALKDRVWTCPSCGEILDRDMNAAINIMMTDRYTID